MSASIGLRGRQAPDTATQREPAPPPRSAAIRVDEVEKVFWTWENRRFSSVAVGGFRALAPTSFTVAAGEFISIVGPSGCGKSTLLSIIAGLSKPTAGSVHVGDRLVTEPGGEDTAMVFQSISLFPWLSARENVMFALDKTAVGRGKTGKRLAEKRADDALRLVGLHGFADRYPHQLSGGMQQRVAIARALVIEPNLLLMDEPFGALDAQTRITLQEELLRLQSEWGGAIVFVTHDIDEAVYLADRVLVMTSRPGALADVVDVPIDRPRGALETRADSRFIELRARIWRTLRPTLETAAESGPPMPAPVDPPSGVVS